MAISKQILRRYLLFLLVILFPWLFLVIIRNFGPIDFDGLSQGTYEYIILFILVMVVAYSVHFYLGFLSRPEDPALVRPEMLSKHSRTFYTCRLVFLWLAFSYAVISLIDFFIVKGAALSQIVELREEEHLTGPRGSIIGFVSMALSSTPPVAFIFYALRPSRTLTHRFFMWSVISIGFGCMFLSGGRNAFFISVCFSSLYIVLFSTKEEFEKVIPRRFRRALVLCVLAGFLFSMKIFVDRIEVQGMAVDDMINHLERDYNVEVETLSGLTGFELTAYSIWVYLAFYIGHALNYLDQYFINLYSPELMGVYNFPVIGRTIDVLFGTSYFEMGMNKLLLKGIYLSMPGSVYVDVGYIGGLGAAGFLGGAYGFLSGRFGNLKIYQKLWFAYLVTIILFSPFYNVIGIANGFSFLISLTIAIFLSLRLNSKRDVLYGIQDL